MGDSHQHGVDIEGKTTSHSDSHIYTFVHELSDFQIQTAVFCVCCNLTLSDALVIAYIWIVRFNFQTEIS